MTTQLYKMVDLSHQFFVCLPEGNQSIAIEIVDFPIKHCDFPISFLIQNITSVAIERQDRIDPDFSEDLTLEVIERGSAVHCVREPNENRTWELGGAKSAKLGVRFLLPPAEG